MRNWRALPAMMVEEVITNHCSGSYPPSLEQMESILETYRYKIVPMDTASLQSALTFHCRRVIFLPINPHAVMHKMLLHELAEILLRLPIAPEFYYPCSDRDEFHEVACLVNRRAK